MKWKGMSALAGALIVSGVASAEFLSVELSTANNNSYINTAPQTPYSALGLQTVRLYVDGIAAGSSLLAVTGVPGFGMTLDTTDPGGFYNAGELGQTNFAPNSALFPTFNDLQWDTYVAIGETIVPGLTPSFPDVALAGGGSPVLNDENISWFNSDPGNPVVEVGGRVLIGQFTVGETFGMSFTLNATVVDPAGGSVRHDGLTIDVPPVPAPGALMLLGVAGLAGVRRRRA